MAALITAADLGIDTTSDQGLFDWLLTEVRNAYVKSRTSICPSWMRV